MAYHRKGGKSAKRRSIKKSKKGGSFGSLMSQLATPAVLFAANHVYGKKTRRNSKKVGGRKYHKKSAKKSKKRSKKHGRK